MYKSYTFHSFLHDNQSDSYKADIFHFPKLHYHKCHLHMYILEIYKTKSIYKVIR